MMVGVFSLLFLFLFFEDNRWECPLFLALRKLLAVLLNLLAAALLVFNFFTYTLLLIRHKRERHPSALSIYLAFHNSVIGKIVFYPFYKLIY